MLYHLDEYVESINNKLNSLYFDSRYRLFWGGEFQSYNIKVNNQYIQKVSLDSDQNLLGYIEGCTNRNHYIINSTLILNFSDNFNSTFSKDIIRFLYLVFIHYGYRKMTFQISTLNNNSLIFVKHFVHKMKIGKIVGTLKDDKRLKDGDIHNVIIVELFQNLFENWFFLRYGNVNFTDNINFIL